MIDVDFMAVQMLGRKSWEMTKQSTRSSVSSQPESVNRRRGTTEPGQPGVPSEEANKRSLSLHLILPGNYPIDPLPVRHDVSV